MNTPSTRSPENEYEKLALCLRTIAWCSENGWKYPGDMVMVPAGNMLDEKNSQLEAVKAELARQIGANDVLARRHNEKEAEIKRLKNLLRDVKDFESKYDEQSDQLKKCEETLKIISECETDGQTGPIVPSMEAVLAKEILSQLHPSKQEGSK